MTLTIQEHTHCEMCGKAIELGNRRCGSEACEKKFQDAIRTKKRGMYMFVGLILLMLLITNWTRLIPA